MPEQPEANLPFECRLCRFWLPLDDVALMMSDGWHCVCYRCWRRETEGLVPEAGSGSGSGSGSGERLPTPHLPFAPPAAGGGTAVAEPPPDDGVLRLRWWCPTCETEHHIPLRNLRRPVCPVCSTALRRWDERFPPDRRR